MARGWITGVLLTERSDAASVFPSFNLQAVPRGMQMRGDRPRAKVPYSVPRYLRFCLGSFDHLTPTDTLPTRYG